MRYESDYNNYLAHSWGPWKNHKYVRVEGTGENKKYYYGDNTAARILDAARESRDSEGAINRNRRASARYKMLQQQRRVEARRKARAEMLEKQQNAHNAQNISAARANAEARSRRNASVTQQLFNEERKNQAMNNATYRNKYQLYGDVARDRLNSLKNSARDLYGRASDTIKRRGVSAARSASMTVDKAKAIAKNPKAYMNSYGSLGNKAKNLKERGKSIVDQMIANAKQKGVSAARSASMTVDKAKAIAKNPKAYMNSYGSLGNKAKNAAEQAKKTATYHARNVKNAANEAYRSAGRSMQNLQFQAKGLMTKLKSKKKKTS